MKNFSGIIPALLTPYTKDGKVNCTVLKAMVRKLIEDGVDGFYVGGSTGEAFMLTTDERKQILEAVVEENDGKVTVISHVGAVGTDISKDLAKHAESVGADAVSSVSPFYYQFTKDEIKGHYLTLCDSVNLPMIIYNFPNFTGFEFTSDFLGDMIEKGNILGVKHTSSNFYQLQQMKALKKDLLVWNGFDEMFLSGLIAGADGGIGSTYNCAPKLYIDIINAYKNEDIEAAQKLQADANSMINMFIKYGVLRTEKEIMGVLGFECNSPRLPFMPLNEEEKAIIKNYVEQTEFIK